MKCSACQLEIVESPRDHYKSELHKINVQRQIYSIPPITVEEYEKEGASSDVSVDINFLEQSTAKNIEKVKTEKKIKIKVNHEICLFCDQQESYEHYLEHDLTETEVSYLMNKTCYVCHEGFTNKPSLNKHLQTDNHRTAVLKNNNLVLDNGKVIYNRVRSVEGGTIIKFTPNGTGIMNFHPNVTEKSKDKNIVEKNKLKVSMGMNSQKHFRPDWMQ
ncbi:hypothetical protein P3W45_000394 [Vairimorpha bombi]|jgi:hypothetical protein